MEARGAVCLVACRAPRRDVYIRCIKVQWVTLLNFRSSALLYDEALTRLVL